MNWLRRFFLAIGEALTLKTYESEHDRGVRAAVDYLATNPSQEDIHRQYKLADLIYFPSDTEETAGFNQGWRKTLFTNLASDPDAPSV